MNHDLEQLALLQAIDLELAHARKQIAEGPKRVARVTSDLREAETALAATEKSLRDEEALRRRLESDADDRRAKLTKLRKQMDTATSTTQVSALEHEISFAEAAIVKLEDDELASLERSEAADKRKALDKGLAERLAATLDRVKSEVSAQDAAARALIADRNVERTGVRSGIDEDRLSVYDRIAKSRGSAVSEAVEHKCSACQMMVRPQRWNDLTGRDHNNEIFSCETCGRMLFWDPRRDAPGAWMPGDRLAAARKLEA